VRKAHPTAGTVLGNTTIPHDPAAGQAPAVPPRACCPALLEAVMAFTDQEKTDIRRFCGYPVFGQSPNQFVDYRFFQAYGNLEYKMNNLLPSEETVLRTIYLAQLYPLEAAIPGAGGNLDTDQAAVWTHNRDEVRERTVLFDLWRGRLCRFLGVPRGEGLCAPDGMREILV
jgi:hypothetical protein